MKLYRITGEEVEVDLATFLRVKAMTAEMCLGNAIRVGLMGDRSAESVEMGEHFLAASRLALADAKGGV